MRYVIPAEEREIHLALTGRVVHVGLTNSGDIELYCLGDPDGPMNTYAFRVYETGETIPSNWFEYIDTVKVGNTAKHIFQFFGEDEPWIPASMSEGVVLSVDNLDPLPSLKLEVIDPSRTA